MMQQVFRIPEGGGYLSLAGKENAGLRHMALDVLRLKAGETWTGATGGEELALITQSGKCSVKVEGKHSADFPSVGGRANMFSGAPGAVYVPCQSNYQVTGTTDVEISVFKAYSDLALPPYQVSADDLKAASVGAANWRRDVRLIFPPGTGKTGRLIVGETINPPGNWSGFPPHKHDTSDEQEYPLEEIYLFKTMPSEGYGVQLIYGGAEGSAAHMLNNNDVAVFRSGYHPCVASPGVQLGFTWALAGADRIYKVSIDPRYRWLSAAEALLKELGR